MERTSTSEADSLDPPQQDSIPNPPPDRTLPLKERCGRVVFIPQIGMAVLFTAPHGVWLHRDGQEDHKPEDYTTFLAKEMAGITGGSVATWSPEEIKKTKATGQPDPENRDPAYLHPAELQDDPWNLILEDHVQRCGVRCVHLDIHGRRDYIPDVNDKSDCDIGLGAMFASDSTRAKQLKTALHKALSRVLATTGYVVNSHPALQGRWSNGRLTLTQQSVSKGMTSVQLELSLSLRKELNKNRDLRRRFGAAIKAAVKGFC